MPKITLFFPKYFDDPCWAGSSFSLDVPEGDHAHGRAGEWVIGRLPTCDITIAIQSISRRHCSMAYSYAADQWAVTDLGGKNGTRLNGELLKPHDPTPVKIGDKLHLGPNPIHLVESPQSTEEIGAPTTIGSITPLDYRTGMALAPPPPPPPAPPPAPLPAAPPPPKTLGDTLYLGASWIIAPSTMSGMVYRLIVLALAALVAVLIMGAL